MEIIDNHTHLFNKKTLDSYLKSHQGQISKSLVLSWYKEDLKKIAELIKSRKDLFLVGNVDMTKPLDEQYRFLENLFKQEKLFGIKFHPGYQLFYPHDEGVLPFANLCKTFNKPLIFHSGAVCEEEGGKPKYSHPKHISSLANKVKDCKLVISHFGFPHFETTAKIINSYPNGYTDVSGLIDESDSKKGLRETLANYKENLQKLVLKYPGIRKKIMFGTDYWGEETPLKFTQPYIDLVKTVFPEKEDQEQIFNKTAKKVFGLK